MNIKYQNLGANKMVTGSCHYLEIGDLKILVDCGLVQDGSKSADEIYKLNTREIPIPISEINYVVIGHGHLDHIGKLGYLPSKDFKGKVITTALTAEIMELNLRDSAYLHNKEIDWMNKRRTKNKLIPLLTQKSVDDILSRVRGYSFNQEIKLNENVFLELIPAGHLSGACMLLFTYRDEFEVKRILFTSDTSGERSVPFTKKANLTKLKVDMIITESTYGNRIHTKELDVVEELKTHVEEICVQNKATLLIPAFAIGRSTNILFYLKQLYDKYPQFKDVPIFFASPMACESHFIIGREDNFDFYDKEWQQYKDLWKWDKVTYIESFERLKQKLDNGNKKIIIASSGMMVGGYSTYLARNFLPNKKSEVLLVGYQGIGTTGRRLIDDEQKTISLDGVQTKIRAKVEMLSGMSSHADQNELISMFSKMEKKKIKKFILVHGDEEQIYGFKKKLQQEFPNAEIIIPDYAQVIKI